LEIVVTVTVVLLETPVPDSEEVVELNGSVVTEDPKVEDAELVDVLAADEEEDEIGVQSGRVKVPLKLPDAPYTTQLETH
jgi:hypothetical protein